MRERENCNKANRKRAYVHVLPWKRQRKREKYQLSECVCLKIWTLSYPMVLFITWNFEIASGLYTHPPNNVLHRIIYGNIFYILSFAVRTMCFICFFSSLFFFSARPCHEMNTIHILVGSSFLSLFCWAFECALVLAVSYLVLGFCVCVLPFARKSLHSNSSILFPFQLVICSPTSVESGAIELHRMRKNTQCEHLWRREKKLRMMMMMTLMFNQLI